MRKFLLLLILEFCTLTIIGQVPRFSVPAGFYKSPLSLSFDISTETIVRYTLDGSSPDSNSLIYSTPLQLDSTVVVRARTYHNDPHLLPSEILTNTYYIDFSTDLPIFSLSTHPGNLFDWDTGIYMLGPNASPDYPYLGANFWQDWERPVHVEFFETNHQRIIDQEAGISINGGSVSRTRPMQSLRLTADSMYGLKRFEHRFFTQKPINKYKMLVLRNSSGDYNKTHFRDGSLHKLMIGKLDIDLLCYRPCIVFINGKYWGIHNIREKFSKHYLEENYGVDGDNVDLLEEDSTIIHGDFGAFNDMISFVNGNDMSIAMNYDSVAKLIDIQSLCDYFIAETYLSNIDWPKNNIKYWRVRERGWKWRYLLMDLDISLGNWGWAPAEMDVLGRLLGPYGYGNKHAELLKGLLHNKGFREYFINRYADLVNTIFSEESIKKNVAEVKSVIESEMPRHFQRWPTNTVEGWNDEINNVVIPYIEKRPLYALQFVRDTFNLHKIVTIGLDVWPPSSGNITINSIKSLDLPWKGKYFDGVPVNITVTPNTGFHFFRWDVDSLEIIDSKSSILQLNVNENAQFTALFEPDNHTSSLYVFPNPAENTVNSTILTDDPLEGFYTIYNMLGQLVFKTEYIHLKAGSSQQTFDLTGLSTGLYLVKFISPVKEYSGRIVKSQ